MKYESQKIALNYFVVAALLFALQIVFGLILGAKYVWDFDPLMNILPFNTARAIHINLLVVWLLFGFMGGTYYIVPEEAQTEFIAKNSLIFSSFCSHLSASQLLSVISWAGRGACRSLNSLLY
jgi:nitric oxide reductase large subunit